VGKAPALEDIRVRVRVRVKMVRNVDGLRIPKPLLTHGVASK